MTNKLRAGSGSVSEPILALANALRDVFPEPLLLITGLTLSGEKGQPVALDLLLLTQMAAFVAIATGPAADKTTTPHAAAEYLAGVVEQQRLMPQALPVYAFWYGPAAPLAPADDTPHLRDTTAVREFILLANNQESRLQWPVITALADRLYQLDAKPAPGREKAARHQKAARQATPPFRRALRRLGALPGRVDAGLQEFIRQPLFLHGRKPIQPADVNRYLERTMLDRENALEDVDYSKIVPNDFLVEINNENYERNYRPIARQVTDQWQARLLEALNVANGRMGRLEYKFGGLVQVVMRPNADLAPGEVRIFCRISQDVARAPGKASAACLQPLPDGPQLTLPEGITTIGRSRRADIHLDAPLIQETRLVSGVHAYFVVESGQTRLFDGTPSGKASTNGTFVNGHRVTPAGQELRNGDLIILAALDPAKPRQDTPGIALFSFQRHCI